MRCADPENRTSAAARICDAYTPANRGGPLLYSRVCNGPEEGPPVVDNPQGNARAAYACSRSFHLTPPKSRKPTKLWSSRAAIRLPALGVNLLVTTAFQIYVVLYYKRSPIKHQTTTQFFRLFDARRRCRRLMRGRYKGIHGLEPRATGWGTSPHAVLRGVSHPDPSFSVDADAGTPVGRGQVQQGLRRRLGALRPPRRA